MKIQSVFSKWLAREARHLESKGMCKIIPVSQFPEGSPLHEDGSSVYDPMKPLVYFAICLRNKSEISAWDKICHEFDKKMGEFQSSR